MPSMQVKPSARDRIIEAARAAFRSNGIAATPLDEVAALAGVARPNLYRYFASREELVRQVMIAEVRSVNAARWERITLTGPVRPLILDSLVTGHDLSQDYMANVTLVAEAASITAELMSHDEGLAAAQYEYWGPLLDYGRGRGEIAVGLSNERIVRWFLTNHVLVAERPELIPDRDLRSWFSDFVVPPVLAAQGGTS
ncbi:TetR/AcrR family transcriptional regulator [Sporichthya sp.]|uniref:TetR/AcrR family transcriptional regulator n=1 Tax=Sporichthya sp. TaxID=65475 RepID=UPI00178D6B60|nr:TetR/AcrR family transcriptional regulator [Sporichthya sp.]MBA3743319.1 TetR/AcrR family transcriptional regulator [Sporichthya sp.]